MFCRTPVPFSFSASPIAVKLLIVQHEMRRIFRRFLEDVATLTEGEGIAIGESGANHFTVASLFK